MDEPAATSLALTRRERARRRFRDTTKRVLRAGFGAGQALGVDILPRHFYSSVPHLRELLADDSWRHASSMPGVRGADPDAQWRELVSWFTPEVRAALRATDVYRNACADNGAEGFGPMESQILHAFVAARRPARVVQVGAGVATSVMLAAADAHDIPLNLVAIDPYPTPMLQRLAAEGRIELRQEPAQTVDMSVFTDLGPGDLLFIDSTHTVKPGSEVNRLVLEVFPQLKAGVYTHLHDMYFPYDFPPDLAERLFFWNESTLVHAYLINNARTSLLVSGSWLALTHGEQLAQTLVGYDPARVRDGLFEGPRGDAHFPSSAYLVTQQ